MIQNLYLISVVVFRTAAIFMAGSALISFLFRAFLSGGGAGFLLLFSTLPLILISALLWYGAKPAARLITSDLGG